MTDLVAQLVGALEWTIRELDRNTCTHEETHRGGAIWTICDGCGMKWADDRGGFKPYKEPAQLKAARSALSAAKDGGWVAVQGEPVAWQHEDGSESFISHRTKVTKQADHKWPYYYSIPLYRAVDEFPDGFVVVPIEPTEAMQNAGALAHQCSPAHDFIGPIHDAYAAMLAARPLPNPPKGEV